MNKQINYLTFLGILGLLGCATLIIGSVIAPFFVPDYNWISDTISDLAAGNSEIIMDTSLYIFGAGLFAISLAASYAHSQQNRWSVGVLSLSIIAALIIIIAARNEYGDKDNEGIVIHIYLVYAMGLLFFITPLCFANYIGKYNLLFKKILITAAIIWAISTPIFFFVPTAIDGLIERILGLIACLMVSIWSIFYIRYNKIIKS